MVYQSPASIFYGRSPSRSERLLFEIIEGRQGLDSVSKAAGMDTEQLGKDAAEFITKMASEANNFKPGSHAMRAYQHMVSTATEIVSKFGTKVDEDLLRAASQAVPGMRPRVMRSPEIPVDTDQFGFPKGKRASGDY